MSSSIRVAALISRRTQPPKQTAIELRISLRIPPLLLTVSPLFCLIFSPKPFLDDKLSEPSQVQGAAFALQIGVDALLLGPDPDLWEAAVSAREQRGIDGPTTGVLPKPVDHSGGGARGGSDAVALSTGRVTRTREGGVGDRVCVDLIQSLKAGEGMLVGSSAKMLALVHAETFETGFVPARRGPFFFVPFCSTRRGLSPESVGRFQESDGRGGGYFVLLLLLLCFTVLVYTEGPSTLPLVPNRILQGLGLSGSKPSLT